MRVLEMAVEQLVGTVGDVMTETVHTAPETMPAAEAAVLMAEHNLHRLVVVGSGREVVGVVSQRDILRNYLATTEKLTNEEAGTFGTTHIRALITRVNPVTVVPETALVKAAVVLATNKIGCLPVVTAERGLVGFVTITDILEHITGHSEGLLEESFQLYTPQADSRVTMPAFVRKMTGDIVVPLSCLTNPEGPLGYAQLGYDPPAGRILIKFVKENERTPDTVRTKRSDENLVIPASGFVAHFDLAGKATAFDVADHKESRYLILSPRQSA